MIYSVRNVKLIIKSRTYTWIFSLAALLLTLLVLSYTCNLIQPTYAATPAASGVTEPAEKDSNLNELENYTPPAMFTVPPTDESITTDNKINNITNDTDLGTKEQQSYTKQRPQGQSSKTISAYTPPLASSAPTKNINQILVGKQTSSNPKIYDAPTKNLVYGESPPLNAMPTVPDQQKKSIAVDTNEAAATVPVTVQKAQKDLPIISSEDILAHRAENNHVLTLRADGDLDEKYMSNNLKPTKLSVAPEPLIIQPSTPTVPTTVSAPPLPVHKPPVAKNTSAKPEGIAKSKIKQKSVAKVDLAKEDRATNAPLKKIDSSTSKSSEDHSAQQLVLGVPKKADTHSSATEPLETNVMNSIADKSQGSTVEKKDTQAASALAAMTTKANFSEISQFSLEFAPSATDLTQDQQALLRDNVINNLVSNPKLRVQVFSYASRINGAESSARRVSLSRALAARSYLLENKINPTRIDVRALGDNTTESPTDRMDLEFTN